jgi:hypothetical protein
MGTDLFTFFPQLLGICQKNDVFLPCRRFLCPVILKIKERPMPQTETMTLDEKFAIGRKALELRAAGDEEGYSRLTRTMPPTWRR